LNDYSGKLGVSLDGSPEPEPDSGDEGTGDDAKAPPTGDDADDAPTGDDAGSEDGPQITNDSGYGADAKPPCIPANCNGCCTESGDCAGGAQVSACGAGAVACTDCSKSGQACNGTACFTPKPDAGPPPACDATKCKACSFLQLACCTNNACGCKYDWSSSCQ
jgi:hypothetical protein